MKNSLQKGFTLIELLVVIAIIAILSAIVITSLAPAQKKARVAAFQSEVRSAAAGFVLLCDDMVAFDSSTPVAVPPASGYPADSSNVEWSTLPTSAFDTGACEDRLGQFTISNIPAAVASIDCTATIDSGNVTFTGADCS